MKLTVIFSCKMPYPELCLPLVLEMLPPCRNCFYKFDYMTVYLNVMTD